MRNESTAVQRIEKEEELSHSVQLLTTHLSHSVAKTLLPAAGLYIVATNM
jgi:hypothetical protein